MSASSMSDIEMFHPTPLKSTIAADQIYKEDMNMRWISPESKSECLFNPYVCDTFLQLKDVSVVLVPWRVFHKRPDFLHSAFHYDHGQIVYSDDVNVMMDAPMLKASSLGHLDEFTQTWEVKVKTEEELDAFLIRLASFPSVLTATLMKRNVLGANSEIPTVLFLDPSSGCIQELAQKLGEFRKTFRGEKRFSVEVDLGPSVEMWSKQVLRRDFLCVGARFCVTNGSTFNHMWDMINILGCLPCLICGLIGTSVYRTNRKLKYIDVSRSGLENIATVGTETQKASCQRLAIYKLMTWIHTVQSPICENCNDSFSKLPNNVECVGYHVAFQEQQHFNDKSTVFASSNNDMSKEENHVLNDDGDDTQTDESDGFSSDNTTENINEVFSDVKHNSQKEPELEQDVEQDVEQDHEPELEPEMEAETEVTKALERRMFLLPYHEEVYKYQKDKNARLAVGNNSHFVKSKKIFRNHDFRSTNNSNVILGPLKDSPYNETNVTSIKRLRGEQIEDLQLSILKDEELLKRRNALHSMKVNGDTGRIMDVGKQSADKETFRKTPTVLCEDKQFIDMSRHATDEVFPTSINVVCEEPEFEEDVPVPHGSIQDDYACEFSQRHTADGHALVLHEKPQSAFFDEFDPLSHVDVLNFLACKNAKKTAAKSVNTKTPPKGKRNRPIRSQPRSENVNTQESQE